jgi:dolichol-phosphate mannosyltransferase
VRIAEVPYVFRDRRHGESKLNFTVGFEYLVLLIGKCVGYTIPLSFALFSVVGLLGLFLYWITLAVLFRTGFLGFVPAALIGTGLAMVSNFLLNNLLTHRVHRITGWSHIVTGLLAFAAACSIGALANIAVSQFLLSRQVPWFWAGTAGIVVGSVWNYSVTGAFIWHIDQRRMHARTVPGTPVLSGDQTGAGEA